KDPEHRDDDGRADVLAGDRRQLRAGRHLGGEPRASGVAAAGARVLPARARRVGAGGPRANARQGARESQRLRGRGAMSDGNVERVMNRLLSEEDLRIRFVLDRFATLADLHDGGLALTPDEIDMFVQSDAEIWFGNRTAAGHYLH